MSNTFEDIATNYSETAAWRLPDPQLDSVTRLDAILRSSLSTDADHRSALERCRTESLNAARKLLSNPFLLPYEVASIKHSASACSAASSVDDGYTKLNRLASAMIWPQTASIYHADWWKMIGAGKSDDGADPSCVTKSDFDRAALTVLPYLRSSLQPIRNKAAANDDSYGDYDETIPEEFDYPYHAAMLGMILANENVVCAKSAFERQVLREMEAIYAACINEETATVNQSRLMSDLEDLATAYHGDGSTEPGPAFALIRSTPNDVEIMRADSPERARRGPPPGMLAMLRKAWISRIAKNNRGN